MSLKNHKIPIILSVSALLLAVLFAYFYTNSRNAPPEQRTETSVYEKVLARDAINVAYYIGEPYLIKDSNTGEMSGIFYEVVEAVGKNLNLKINWTTEVGFPEMAAGLDAGKYDIVGSGIWINSARGRSADFSIPVLYDVVGAYVRADDHRFDGDLSKVNDRAIKISTLDGEMAQSIAQTDFPTAQTLSLTQNSDFATMLKNVVDKKADITFAGIAAANKFNQNNNNALRNITPEIPVRVFPTAVMIKRGEYEFTQMFNHALMELINSGQVEKIIKKYEAVPNSHYRVASPFQPPSAK